jgi:hypothetical protein
MMSLPGRLVVDAAPRTLDVQTKLARTAGVSRG